MDDEDAVLRVLVDKYKPLCIGAIRTTVRRRCIVRRRKFLCNSQK